MVTKKDLETAIAAYGLGRVLPAGSTRAAARSAVGAIVKGGRLLVRPTIAAVPAAARTIGGLSPQGRAILAGLTLKEAYDRGLLDAPIQQGRDIFADTVAQGIETVDPFMPQGGPPPGFQGFGAKPKRKPSKYNKAVKAGMAAVKKSKFGGKKGTISNAKSTFKTVNLVASAVNKGKKVSAKGIRGTIARAVRRIL